MPAYTKAELFEKIERAARDISHFYQQDFVNYRGRTSDTKELYTELIAEWCIDHLSLFDGITQITREKPYQRKSRDGTIVNQTSNRTEERIAKELHCRILPVIGKIMDYQTPLKNKRSDSVGKIDLLAFDGKILRILELKEPESQETMLRCVLEGFTYLQTVDQRKLISDFSLPAGTIVSACPLVFADGPQHREMQENRPQLKRLAALLDSHPLYLSQHVDGSYGVAEG